MDLLTNGLFDIREFCYHISPEVFKREAKYASIRFSFHEGTNFVLADKVWALQNSGYEVGIWGVNHPHGHIKMRNKEMKKRCKWLNLDYREKEFLGQLPLEDKLHGTYKYPDAVNAKKRLEKVWCKPSELLINPSGYIYRCHADLYACRNYIGHILDPDVNFDIGFKECENYGTCNPCDIKLKTDRFQEEGHCSVQIKGKGVVEHEQ